MCCLDDNLCYDVMICALFNVLIGYTIGVFVLKLKATQQFSLLLLLFGGGGLLRARGPRPFAFVVSYKAHQETQQQTASSKQQLCISNC